MSTTKSKSAPVAATPKRNETEPEPPQIGALIDPNGTDPLSLSKEEYKMLRSCLEAYRSDDPCLSDAATAFLSFHNWPDKSFAGLAKAMIASIRQEHDGTEIDGLLISRRFDEPILLDLSRDEGSGEVLAALLAILRAGGWFAEWLTLQIKTFSNPEETRPTPLQIMSTLTLAIAEFERDRKAAGKMLKAYPHLFSGRAREEETTDIARHI